MQVLEHVVDSILEDSNIMTLLSVNHPSMITVMPVKALPSAIGMFLRKHSAVKLTRHLHIIYAPSDVFPCFSWESESTLMLC